MQKSSTDRYRGFSKTSILSRMIGVWMILVHIVLLFVGFAPKNGGFRVIIPILATPSLMNTMDVAMILAGFMYYKAGGLLKRLKTRAWEFIIYATMIQIINLILRSFTRYAIEIVVLFWGINFLLGLIVMNYISLFKDKLKK